MFLGMQDFNFTQSNNFYPNFTSIFPKFQPNLPKFAQKIIARKCGCIPSSYGTTNYTISVQNCPKEKECLLTKTFKIELLQRICFNIMWPSLLWKMFILF